MCAAIYTELGLNFDLGSDGGESWSLVAPNTVVHFEYDLLGIRNSRTPLTPELSHPFPFAQLIINDQGTYGLNELPMAEDEDQ
jgi:hypothetical protein